MEWIRSRFTWTLFLLFVLIISRLAPHAPNFTAAISCLIFGAASIRSVKFFGFYVLTYWISDLFINNLLYPKDAFSWFSTGFHWVLLIYAAVFMLNSMMSFSPSKAKSVFAASVASSLLFFVLSNLAVWINSTTYSNDISGLATCFTMAIPFLNTELLGTLFYSSVLYAVCWIFKPNLALETSDLHRSE